MLANAFRFSNLHSSRSSKLFKKPKVGTKNTQCESMRGNKMTSSKSKAVALCLTLYPATPTINHHQREAEICQFRLQDGT